MKPKILIVDDEASIRMLLTDVLEAVGNVAIEAKDGREAVETARAANPSVILMDVQMPVMDGITAVKILKSDPTLCAIPVVAVTAQAMNGDRERLLAAGFDEYLGKPVSIDEFRNVVSRLAKTTPVKEACAERAPEIRVSPARKSATAKVMVVDDDDRLRALLEARIESMGHEVVLAVDGEDAVEKANIELPDLILLDVMMPKLDGIAAAQRLKDSPQTGHIPIVMVTALGAVQDRVRALDAGADDFLTKPVDPIELKARVQSLLKIKAYNDHMRHYQQELESEVARKTESLQGALHKIQEFTFDTIYRLSRAAEYKDEDTGAHVRRVSHYAAAISRQMGQTDAFTEMLLYAVPMHDVGKIGIPDNILLKPGKLNPDEWQTMQMHTEIGPALLAGSDRELLQMAATIAWTHHERWNGSGYPRGLRGEDIPLVGRITAVADVFDALCSKRPYKEAYSVEKSLDIIRAKIGQHFDPRVVEAFLDVLPEILTIKEKFKDRQETISIHRERMMV